MKTFHSEKEVSVTLSLKLFSTLNGELAVLSEPQERELFLTNFFRKRYGDGAGKLSVLENQGQALLSWKQSRVDPRAETVHQEALRLAKSKNYADAITTWVKAVSLNPSDPDYYFNLGIAFFETRNYKESIENLSSVLSLCPIYYKARLILGTAYLKSRKYDDSEEHLKESLIFYPKHPLAYLNLGAVYSIQRKYKDAIKMFLTTIDLSPKEVRAHFGLGKIYSLQRDFVKADEYFQNVVLLNTNEELTVHAKRAMANISGTISSSSNRVAENHPNEVISNTKEIERFYQEGFRSYLVTDYDRSSQMYNAYLKQRPGDDFVWFSLGEAELRAGNVQAAAEAFKQAIKHNGNKAVYYKELGVAYNYLNLKDDALRCLEKAQQLGKVDSVSYTIWGKILIEQGFIEDALKRLEEAIRLNSNNLLARYNMAIAAAKNNQPDLASNLLHEIARAPVESPIKGEAETALKELLT